MTLSGLHDRWKAVLLAPLCLIMQRLYKPPPSIAHFIAFSQNGILQFISSQFKLLYVLKQPPTELLDWYGRFLELQTVMFSSAQVLWSMETHLSAIFQGFSVLVWNGQVPVKLGAGNRVLISQSVGSETIYCESCWMLVGCCTASHKLNLQLASCYEPKLAFWRG